MASTKTLKDLEGQEQVQESRQEQEQEHVHVHGPNCNHHHHDALKPIVRDAPKIGRNDPCLCGSQKKYKKCCGI